MSDIFKDLDDPIYFEFDGKSHMVDPESELAVDESNISREFSRQASLYAYVTIVVARVDATVKRKKLNLSECQAAAYLAIREEYEETGRKATEAMVNANVVIDDDVRKAQRDLIEAQEALKTVSGIESAFRMRSDMLVNIGFRQRTEMEQTGMNVPEEKMREAVKRARSK